MARILLAIATVAALGAGMAGFAFADEPETDPPVVDDTTTTTTSTETTDPPVDTPVDPPTETDNSFGALDVGALALPTIQVTKNTNTDYPGTFWFRAQKQTCVLVVFCSWGSTIEQSITTTPSGSTTTGSTTFNLSSTGTWRIQEITGSGSLFTGATPGWTYQSVVCSPSGSSQPNGRSFSLATDANASCTFTNTENAVTVTKNVTNAPDSSWSFPIRLVSLATYDQTLNFTAAQPTQTFHAVPAALLGFALTESTPEGWRLTSATCTGSGNTPFFELIPLRQTGVAFGGLLANPTRSCTFTNANNRVAVQKVVDPESYAGSFDVVLEECEFNVLGLCLGNWDEVQTGSVTGTTPVVFDTLAGTYFDRYYRVHEVVPDGWTSSISCSGGRAHSVDDGYAYFLFPLDLNAAANVSCTLTNTAEPSSLRIEKTTDPSGGGPFGFTSADFGPFELSDSQFTTFDGLDPGDYSFTEATAPVDEDWVLVNVDCEVDPDSPNTAPVTPVDDGNGSWTVPIGAGQDVTCTVDNRQASIGLDITPTPSSGVVGDTITFEYTVTNTGKVPLTNVTVVSSLFGPITLGATDLAPGASTSGTHDHTAVAGDVPQITDTATATGDIDTSAITLDVGSQALDPVSVTATSEATVGIAEVGGETVTRGDTTGSALPFTGSDSGLLDIGLVVLGLGLALGALGWRRRRSLLDA